MNFKLTKETKQLKNGEKRFERKITLDIVQVKNLTINVFKQLNLQ